MDKSRKFLLLKSGQKFVPLYLVWKAWCFALYVLFSRQMEILLYVFGWFFFGEKFKVQMYNLYTVKIDNNL